MTNKRAKCMSCMRTNLLTILTLIGVVVGSVLGIILRSTRDGTWTEREVVYIQFVGDLFLRILKGLVLPLIVSTLIAAIGSLDLSVSGKMARVGGTYYIITTTIAIVLGIVLAVTIKPGANRSGDSGNQPEISVRNVTTVDTLLDLVRNMFPPNYVQACTQQYQTVLTGPAGYDEPDIYKWKMGEDYVDSMNIIGCVVAAVAFGIAISSLKEQAIHVQRFINDFSVIIMKITSWVIWLSPLGVLFLICAKLIEIDDLAVLVGQLGLYFVTVLGGILFHGFVILPILYFLAVRKNPYILVRNMGQAIATAIGTSSSSATLPVTIRCMEDFHGVDKRVTRFILPIGATINMDGTALYEATAAIFISQLRGMSLSFGQVIAVAITATAASIGAAGIPQAGLVTMVMVLDTIGLPAEDVSLIIAVDWLLDRFRTVVNIMGDAYGAAIIAHYAKDELAQMEVEPEESHQKSNGELTAVNDLRL
ncbi:hypothetical protein HA402_002856 [Bradysia odoriphaga]|nr:hypothetical protein HA402_002856 [Bradysia odoriphaga]